MASVGEDTSDEILIHIHPERLVDLLRDSKTAEAWVTLSLKAASVGLVQQSFGWVPAVGLWVLAFLFCSMNTAVGTCAFKAGCEI